MAALPTLGIASPMHFLSGKRFFCENLRTEQQCRVHYSKPIFAVDEGTS